MVQEEARSGADLLGAETDAPGVVDAASNANGEELVFLGALKTINYDLLDGEGQPGSDNDIDVFLNNTSGIDAATGPVSLVLSAAESLQWNVTWDTNVTLNNIFIFGVNAQALQINGSGPIDLSSGEATFNGITIKVSNSMRCGYSLPYNAGGCNTDQILGLNPFTATNPIGFNFLADETDLNVTNFNGSNLVDAFNVDISTATVVPLPSALLLFASAFGLMFNRKLAAHARNSGGA